MGNESSADGGRPTTVVAITTVGVGLATGAAYMYLNTKTKSGTESPKIFQHETLGPKVKAILAKHVDKMTSPESLLKITRQLDFWLSEKTCSETDVLELTESLAERATILSSSFQCPKKRFGKTELQMPMVTCGGMRLQQTWMPDMMPWPLSPRKAQVLHSASQTNLVHAIRSCLRVGINHFETARMYGTSEYQFAEALSDMMKSGEIKKREDFIFQTKISPTATRKEFADMFEKTWANCEKIGYIDLLSMWCASSKEQTAMVLKEDDDSCMAVALELQRQGKIKHIGFSTHGPADNILEMINSERFSYVNLHAHYLTSYHATGTPDDCGGEGNQRAVQRALELDMGVFLISPIDKGGALYNPSRIMAKVLGPKMTPIEFAMLAGWHAGHHTASVGFARPVDIEDSLVAARRYTEASSQQDLQEAVARMEKHMEETLGKQWKEKGLLNIPSCEHECTHGTAIGHILSLYNLMKAFGLYDFCAARYGSLKGCKWDKKKTFEENRLKVPGGNMGRAYIPGTDYSKALESHYDAQAAEARMKQVDQWMMQDGRKSQGSLFDSAYDLRVWTSYPGDTVSAQGAILQNLSGGYLGCGGGPTQSAAEAAARLVEEIKAG